MEIPTYPDEGAEDDEAAELVAEVIVWVGTHDPVMARKVRNLGAHVMRMRAELARARRS